MTSSPLPAADVIAHAAALLRSGGLVAFPTETVYGLGAHALDERAVRRIFEAKGRPSFNPLIVHVTDAGAARALVTEWPDAAGRLAARFWPGPLTLVLPKRSIVPDVVTAGLGAVAVRVPAHPVALALLRAADLPIAAPSANRSTEVSPTTAAHVRKSLGDRVDFVLDGGPTTVGIESTVVDLSGERPLILRPGGISAEQLQPIVGPVGMAGEVVGDVPRASPGQMERHYAPRATLYVVTDPAEGAMLLAEARGARKRSGALVRRWELPADVVKRLPEDPEGYARALYAALHELDDSACAVIVAEGVPDTSAWAAVRDRLRRAAHAG